MYVYHIQNGNVNGRRAGSGLNLNHLPASCQVGFASTKDGQDCGIMGDMPLPQSGYFWCLLGFDR